MFKIQPLRREIIDEKGKCKGNAMLQANHKTVLIC